MVNKLVSVAEAQERNVVGLVESVVGLVVDGVKMLGEGTGTVR